MCGTASARIAADTTAAGGGSVLTATGPAVASLVSGLQVFEVLRAVTNGLPTAGWNDTATTTSPTASPTARPTAQPSAQPSARPTHAPSLATETCRRNEEDEAALAVGSFGVGAVINLQTDAGYGNGKIAGDNPVEYVFLKQMDSFRNNVQIAVLLLVVVLIFHAVAACVAKRQVEEQWRQQRREFGATPAAPVA